MPCRAHFRFCCSPDVVDANTQLVLRLLAGAVVEPPGAALALLAALHNLGNPNRHAVEL